MKGSNFNNSNRSFAKRAEAKKKTMYLQHHKLQYKSIKENIIPYANNVHFNGMIKSKCACLPHLLIKRSYYFQDTVIPYIHILILQHNNTAVYNLCRLHYLIQRLTQRVCFKGRSP